ncbi:MAG TPA: PHP domain-containing protein [Longimicrobiales bacterium]
MRIDLHLHSTASDGTLAPDALALAARDGGLDVIALTDHDTAAGLPQALSSAGSAIRVISGIEISSTHAGCDLHFLGYAIDPAAPAIVEHAHAAIARRRERMRGMIRRLADLGITVHFDEVLAAAGPDAAALGRPHLARVLVDHGHAATIADAFDRYLADGGPAFLPIQLLTPAEAIERIHAAGGTAVWAHPPADLLDRELPNFIDSGLDGLECFRPRSTPAEVRRLVEMSRTHGLLMTGGSDWHGPWNGALGEFHVGHAQLRAFLERIGL